MIPAPEAVELAARLGISLDDFGFCRTDGFSPLSTSLDGVFACGVFQGPKDIPETVVQAGAAAEAASAFLSEVRGTLTRQKDYPPERDVAGQAPRIGIFVCHCGINIGGIVNVSEVKEYARTLPDVAYVDENLYTCSQDTQEKIKKAIEEHHLNRVVVASCSPRTHEPLFQETIREIGLNKYLFEMANIRDQCSWVHMLLPLEATAKAKDLLRMAVAKARLLQPLEEPTLGITKKALVIGGGLAGMNPPRPWPAKGFTNALVEKKRSSAETSVIYIIPSKGRMFRASKIPSGRFCPHRNHRLHGAEQKRRRLSGQFPRRYLRSREDGNTNGVRRSRAPGKTVPPSISTARRAASLRALEGNSPPWKSEKYRNVA